MGVKVTDYISTITGQAKQRSSTFLRIACDRVVDSATPNTPKDKGNLSRDILRQVLLLHAVIEWRKGYAGAQEAGKRRDPRTGKTIYFKNYTTPGTGPHFAQNAINEVVKDTNIIAREAHLI